MKIKINNKYYDFFDGLTIERKLDAIASSFSLNAKFDPNDIDHQRIFKPLQYQVVKIYNDNDKLLLTGYIVNHSFSSSAKPELKSLSGYSLTGILEDVNIDVSNYPLEKNDISLRQLTTQILKPFGIDFIVSSSITNPVNSSTPSRIDLTNDMDILYESTTAEPNEKIKDYLSKLAAQRNIVLSHNQYGQLVFYRPISNSKPKFYFTDENTIKMSLSVNGQGLHSKISTIRQPGFLDNLLGNDETPQDSVYNSIVGKFKPFVKVLSSGESEDTTNASNSILGTELKNIQFTADIKGYLDIDPSDEVEVQNKDIYIYNRTKLMVIGVKYTETSKGGITSISMVVPQTFKGGSPSPSLFATN